MNADALTRSWAVGSRTCSLSVPPTQPGAPLSVCMAWQPSPPPKLTRAEWHEYRAGRDAALAELALSIGGGAIEVAA